MPTIEEAKKLYPPSDGVHGFDHVERVYHMALKIGKTEGADLEIIKAAALLHDVEGSAPGKKERANHHESSADFAASLLRKEGWGEDRIAAVLHCIRAHRYRSGGEAPNTIEAKCLFDADKLDVLGAIGVARTVAYAVLAGTPHYAEPSEQFITTGKEMPGELHSAYHEYLYKLNKVKDRLFTKTAKTIAEQRHQFMVTYFEQLKAEMDGER
jgi:uncharacterized protein